MEKYCGRLNLYLGFVHGEVEVFNKRGKHLGVMNHEGMFIKPPIRGRQLNV